jgi:hypothetical protein
VCLGRWFPLSPRSARCTPSIPRVRRGRAMLFSHRNGNSGILPANAIALNTPDKLPRSRSAPPTQANPADNLPQVKTLPLVWTWSSRAMALNGLRMMPLSPSPPLKFRTARFPRYGFKADISDGAFPSTLLLKLAPSMRRPVSGLLPSFAPTEIETLVPVLSREGTLLTTPSCGLHSPTPGVLAPVGVIVSPSIHA